MMRQFRSIITANFTHGRDNDDFGIRCNFSDRTALVWFFISLKGGAISALQPADIALVRFLVPSLILLPFVMKHKVALKVVPNQIPYWYCLG